MEGPRKSCFELMASRAWEPQAIDRPDVMKGLNRMNEAEICILVGRNCTTNND